MNSIWKIISYNNSEATLAMEVKNGVILRVDIKTHSNGVSTSMIFIKGASLKLKDNDFYEIV